jgi:nucleotide-binding universal stress UspA family protein
LSRQLKAARKEKDVTVLFAYDGLESADAAIAAARHLLGGRGTDAVVLSVWEPLVVEALRAMRFGGRFPMLSDVADIDAQSEDEARQLAEHGARLAGEAGFEARPLWVADTRAIADAIVEGAEELNVDLIVLGARGLTGIRAFLGSVSNRVLQHAYRAVLVIPAKSVSSMAPGGDRAERVATVSR